jgi:hypothetical protein
MSKNLVNSCWVAYSSLLQAEVGVCLARVSQHVLSVNDYVLVNPVSVILRCFAKHGWGKCTSAPWSDSRLALLLMCCRE